MGQRDFTYGTYLSFPILYSFYMGNLDFSVTKDLQIFYSLLYFRAERRKEKKKIERQYLPELSFVDLLCLYIYRRDWFKSC